jgi:hypothetical protein
MSRRRACCETPNIVEIYPRFASKDLVTGGSRPTVDKWVLFAALLSEGPAVSNWWGEFSETTHQGD